MARQNYPIFRKKCARRQLKAGFFSYPFIKIFDVAHFALPYGHIYQLLIWCTTMYSLNFCPRNRGAQGFRQSNDAGYENTSNLGLVTAGSIIPRPEFLGP